jgi:hypothetical protein
MGSGRAVFAINGALDWCISGILHSAHSQCHSRNEDIHPPQIQPPALVAAQPEARSIF